MIAPSARNGEAIASDREALERLYMKYNDARFVSPDPLEFVYRYEDRVDREVAALIASSLAFGTVKHIRTSVARALEPLGGSPAEALRAASTRELAAAFEGFRHRWITGADMAAMLGGVRAGLREHGSLRQLFYAGFDASDADVAPAAARLAEYIRRAGAGFRPCLLPSPASGSACKRLNLFLRWMVRSDAVDPGGWDEIPRAMLIVPLDTHMHRISRELGLTKRGTADLATAREITDGFRRVSPDDPVKYDFALTRLGILKERGEERSRAGLSC
ncbi:MAG TPA: TIGR02757 family protein [Candidatus Bathyarchaeia archaeon]|nr:TIGR02757 family protein [Candidatus Bathyarchaeia archaeon]